jgi:hypothetical protein
MCLFYRVPYLQNDLIKGMCLFYRVPYLQNDLIKGMCLFCRVPYLQNDLIKGMCLFYRVLYLQNDLIKGMCLFFKFHGVHITNKLSWSKRTKTVVKRAWQHIFPLRRLKIFGIVPQILKRFYSCTIESILTDCITSWYGYCSASDHKALQRVVRTAQYITGAKLSAIQDLYTRRCQRKALKMVKDSSHPSHRL